MTPPTSGPVRLPRATFAEFMAEMASELFSKLLAMIWLSISLAKGMDGTQINPAESPKTASPARTR